MRVRTVSAVVIGALLAAGVLASFAAATANDKVAMQQDCGSPCVEPVDSVGPTGFGFVNYNKNAEGALRVVVALKNAAPSTTYHVYFTCGPTHVTACGFEDIGTLTTNGQGNGNTGAIVLAAPPYVGGPSDHIDVMKLAGDLSAGLYVSTPIVN